MTTAAYESRELLSQYLLFHYGAAEEILPPALEINLTPALEFPVRCVAELIDLSRLSTSSRALDLGCAVGRSTFELCRHCGTVLGIDASRTFIDAANQLKAEGRLEFDRTDEGALITRITARVPDGIARSRSSFETGDATDLRDHLGQFDVLLMANLLDRVSDPARSLSRLSGLLNPGGELIITSPYTWLDEFTPRERWLGGFERAGKAVRTFDALRQALEKDFVLMTRRDVPFLIREHGRKFQLGVADATVWRRR